MSQKGAVMDIHITRADIRGGHPLSAGACPIALAVYRALPDVDSVAVGPHELSLSRGGKRYAYRHSAAAFVLRFDVLPRWSRRLMRPFTMQVELVERYGVAW